MLLLSSNKTGLWSMLVLQLLCLSLYPACGRPSFEDEDEDLVEDDEDHEEDEDLVDDQNQDGLEDGSEDEEDGATPQPQGLDLCAQFSGLSLEDCLKKLVKENGLNVEDCAILKGKSYIDCLKNIIGQKGLKSGSGEQIKLEVIKGRAV